MTRLVNGLKAVVSDLELPAALASSVAIEALFGEQPEGVMRALAREVHEADEGAGRAKKHVDEEQRKADDDDDDDDLRERFAVPRAQLAFVQHIRGEV